ncbi:MAG: hypothetical protein EI684_16495 [Candidatus Viridilinea halotolerans]|uniref:Uncharacterized protein n=1 Tax=Candidatus Viridilinea halotolerans TaxID=2491704 RepID=A0A426TUT4_9CHLR|nr:MAG: hypothetical protein EI684_16495 [Candidatus Viridilinea halotolerans]
MQGNRGAGEQGSRGTGEQGNRGTEEQRNRGAGEQGSRGTGEQRNRGAGEQNALYTYPIHDSGGDVTFCWHRSRRAAGFGKLASANWLRQAQPPSHQATGYCCDARWMRREAD